MKTHGPKDLEGPREDAGFWLSLFPAWVKSSSPGRLQRDDSAVLREAGRKRDHSPQLTPSHEKLLHGSLQRGFLFVVIELAKVSQGAMVKDHF